MLQVLASCVRQRHARVVHVLQVLVSSTSLHYERVAGACIMCRQRHARVVHVLQVLASVRRQRYARIVHVLQVLVSCVVKVTHLLCTCCRCLTCAGAATMTGTSGTLTVTFAFAKSSSVSACRPDQTSWYVRTCTSCRCTRSVVVRTYMYVILGVHLLSEH